MLMATYLKKNSIILGNLYKVSYYHPLRCESITEIVKIISILTARSNPYELLGKRINKDYLYVHLYPSETEILEDNQDVLMLELI